MTTEQVKGAKQISAYPLTWPVGWKRTPPTQRIRALTVADAVGRLLGELGRLGVPDYNVIISTDVRTRLDGLPYSNQAEPQDPGAAVYWKTRKGEERSMAIDRYTRVADNIAAIAATIEAMRAIERHGGAEILERAFLGFQALPPPINGARPWHEVLGVDPAASLDAAEVSYRIRAKNLHPDMTGGDADKMAELNEAIRQARQTVG